MAVATKLMVVDMTTEGHTQSNCDATPMACVPRGSNVEEMGELMGGVASTWGALGGRSSGVNMGISWIQL
ncbi:putative ABC transporter [Sesbania bispinosa]|nr:putative ABC transporter [Sesbania bispinosa]